VLDRRSGAQVYAPDWSGVDQFAADHSSSGRGLGDVLHSLAQAFGLRRCAPCARRQAVANAWTPWR
jgi:hypothetical protein